MSLHPDSSHAGPDFPIGYHRLNTTALLSDFQIYSFCNKFTSSCVNCSKIYQEWKIFNTSAGEWQGGSIWGGYIYRTPLHLDSSQVLFCASSISLSLHGDSSLHVQTVCTLIIYKQGMYILLMYISTHPLYSYYLLRDRYILLTFISTLIYMSLHDIVYMYPI